MSKLSRILFFVLAFFLAWSFLNPQKKEVVTDDVVLEADAELPVGKVFKVDIQNHTDEALTIPTNCPNSPLSVERYENGQWQLLEAEQPALNCEETEWNVSAGKNLLVDYAPWNNDLFTEKGRYRVSLTIGEGETEKQFTQEFEVTGRGIFRTLWEEAFYRPIFNTLIFFISIQPHKSLGWAIILLTLIIKLILLAPNQKALKSQKQMQKLQPQLDAVKKKYANDQQKLAEETMKIWKKHKVNPMNSCLPMLIQFPILIALFYVVRNGLDFINPVLLYDSLKGFEAASINPVFIGLIDLTKVNILALPIIIGGLQFVQMRMTLGNTAKNQAQNSPMPMMNKTMMYFMPIMIAVFTASLPAAVGFYWGTSTAFGIAQQYFVNRAKD